MNRIASTFQALGDSPALIPFITAGYPTIATCGRILNALPKHGADLVELGMPFSDPVADGKPLQKAADVALENGTGMRQVFELTKQFRTANPNTPLILMGYINPIYQMGYATFARKASQAGADAILVVDLPLEESALLLAALTKQRVCLVSLATPATNNQRLQQMLRSAKGFLYYAAVAAVTGTKSSKVAPLEKKLRYIHSKTSLPVAVGFGFKRGKKIKNANGIVVGSALAKVIEKDKKNGYKNAYKNAISFVEKFGKDIKK